MQSFLSRPTGAGRGKPRPQRRAGLRLESLEDRTVPATFSPGAIALGVGGIGPAAGSSQPSGFNPNQVRHAYGFDQVYFNNGTVLGTGAGQTIAIVDAFDQPNIAGDLAGFDATYGLAAPPSFTKVNQNGGAAPPAANQNWGLEISLDVEWAHAIAPGASILLVEANSDGGSDLLAAVNYARNYPGVSVVSMSWAGGEFTGETSYDGNFTTPAGHNGVTFVASSGDSGSSSGPGWPPVSPNVLGVGGTQLSLTGAGEYGGETAWSGSGGGLATGEAQPAYQKGIVTQSSTQRGVPDVAYDASTASPFAVYDTYSYSGWLQVGGTSAGAPQWAALIAIADQGRATLGKGSLDGGTQTLPMIYQLPASDFHDITTGNNGGYPAGAGYDLVTGRGTPAANRVIAGLAGTGSSAPPSAGDPNAEVFALGANGSLRMEIVATGQWITMTPAGAVLQVSASKTAAGADEAFVLKSDHSVWRYRPSGWQELLPPGSANALSASPNDTVWVVLPSNVLWRWNSAGWAGVTGYNTVLSVSAGLDAHGGAEAFIVWVDRSLWLDDQNVWQPLLPAGSVKSVSAVGDAAFILGMDGSVWEHTSAGWAGLPLPVRVAAISAGTDLAGNPQAIIQGVDQSLWAVSPTQGWTQLSGAGAVASLSDAEGPDFFGGGSDGALWEYNGVTWGEVGP